MIGEVWKRSTSFGPRAAHVIEFVEDAPRRAKNLCNKTAAGLEKHSVLTARDSVARLRAITASDQIFGKEWAGKGLFVDLGE